ncbi:MAG: glutamate 5-kinase [Candidatus Omnitrophota bacterium]|nr:MAG: glutamate 5-kinase [Candidatus Omnitrophota bacterium]
MKIVVVKLGSSVIAPQGFLSPSIIAQLVRDFLAAESKGYKVVIVSSGAIACGLNKLGYKRRPQDMHSLMALSSLGQIMLMDIYAQKFKKHKKLCAQILLTWDDFDNRKRFLNAKYTINKLLNMGVVPIINENDAVSCDEIRFGENDRLAALVADLISAQELVLLSNVEGLIEGDKVIRQVQQIDSKIFQLAKKGGNAFTAGGMVSKLEAAKIATSAGIKTAIANGKSKGVLLKLLEGEAAGTVFLPLGGAAPARKRWIAFGKKVRGKVYIDDGAKEAILNKGKSLLSVGIIKVEGEFKKKDAVEVLDKDGRVCGCGIINYSCEELADLGGKKFTKEVVHRDNFVRR